MASGRKAARTASCEDCFFERRGLCAVTKSGPCGTYRPDSPNGLRPPSQLSFVFRQEKRLQVAFAFPSAQEQLALHSA